MGVRDNEKFSRKNLGHFWIEYKGNEKISRKVFRQKILGIFGQSTFGKRGEWGVGDDMTMSEMLGVLERLRENRKCHLCKENNYDYGNGHKMCLECYAKAEFAAEELTWQGQPTTVEEYLEHRKITNTLAGV